MLPELISGSLDDQAMRSIGYFGLTLTSAMARKVFKLKAVLKRVSRMSGNALLPAALRQLKNAEGFSAAEETSGWHRLAGRSKNFLAILTSTNGSHGGKALQSLTFRLRLPNDSPVINISYAPTGFMAPNSIRPCGNIVGTRCSRSARGVLLRGPRFIGRDLAASN